MRVSLSLFGLVLSLCLLGGCGPKDIGEGASEEFAGTNPAREPEDSLRYPIDNSKYGNRLQQRLYLMNQPDRMIFDQQRRMERFQRWQGVAPGAPDPAATPRQRSPFRD